MAHEWEKIPDSEIDITKRLSTYGARQCKKCGAKQYKEAEYIWMRVLRYRWLPLVGRCKNA